jgi:hypothetical protein
MNEKIYSENQTIPIQLEFPLIAALGAQTKKPYEQDNTLQDMILSTRKRGQFHDATVNDPNLADIDFRAKNDFLDIPSFLSYPLDLGRNRRYHHFIVFNIYQGESDSVRLKQRQLNQVSGAFLAKGQIGLGGQDGSTLAFENARRVLSAAGFDGEQLTELSKMYSKTLTELSTDGVVSDERINALEEAFMGRLQAAYRQKTEEGGQDGELTTGDKFSALVDTAGGFVSDAGGDVWEYVAKFMQETLRDNLDPSNQQPINESQVGVSGKKVNRAKKDNNILLANRRFNFANKKSKDTICLYMPQKIAFNDQLIYSEEDFGMTKQLLDTLATKRGGLSGLVEKAGTSKVADLVSKAGNVVGIDNVNIQGIRNAATRSTANPRREMLFKDVTIRSHSFTFQFAPRNQEEADTVLNIIRMLRYHAYPGLLGGGGHFFTFPAEFQATFYTIAPDGSVLVNDNLPKLPRLALQSVSVDYSDAGDFKTFTDGKPAFIRIDLGFQEMEQLTNEHIIHGY